MNEEELELLSSVRCIIDTWEAEIIIEAISRDLASVLGTPCQYESINDFMHYDWCEECKQKESWECWQKYLTYKIVQERKEEICSYQK